MGVDCLSDDMMLSEYYEWLNNGSVMVLNGSSPAQPFKPRVMAFGCGCRAFAAQGNRLIGFEWMGCPAE